MMKQLMKLVTGIVATLGLVMGLAGITGQAEMLAVTSRINASEPVRSHVSQQPPQASLKSVTNQQQATLPQTDETNPLKAVMLGLGLLSLLIVNRWDDFRRRRF